MFHTEKPFPGVSHISDAMGVCFTLIEGKERAVLFDTGYGTENVREYISTLTAKPVTVVLSHGHHDHVLGARWFSRTVICAEDLEEFRMRTGREQRNKVAGQAGQKAVPVPGDFLTARIAEPIPVVFHEKLGPFEAETTDLGGRKVLLIHVPGHTPGSVVLYVEDCGLLLTGDNWNPCTWMWFPSSAPVRKWRDNMKTLIGLLPKEAGVTFRHVLCSHQPAVRTAQELTEYLDYMTDERISTASQVEMGSTIHTCEIRMDSRGWTLVYDKDKA